MLQDGSPRKRAGRIVQGRFAAVIRAFMSEGNPRWARYSAATRELWGRELRRAEHPETLGALFVHEVNSQVVQGYLDGLAEWPAKQMAALAALRQFEKWALVRGHLPHPITLGCEAEGSDGGHVPWADDQVQLAELHAAPHISRAITLAANTGQRVSDLVKMRWTDIEVYEGRPGINVTQKKTGKKLWVPFTEKLSEVMATWERRPGFVLLKADGTPFVRKQLTTQWNWERDHNEALAPLRREAIIAIVPGATEGLVMHGLRATACVRLLRAGANTRQISDMVGMSEQMVRRYTRFSEQRENAIAAVLHLDRRRPEAKSLKLRDRT